jgi:hypothetical protein
MGSSVNRVGVKGVSIQARQNAVTDINRPRRPPENARREWVKKPGQNSSHRRRATSLVSSWNEAPRPDVTVEDFDEKRSRKGPDPAAEDESFTARFTVDR